MSQKFLELAQKWAQNPYFDPASRKEIQNLLDQNNTAEITERFYQDVEFGTGGIRGIIGMGPNRMSHYTVRRATQALIMALEEQYPQKKLRILISYDSRTKSSFFAEEAACVIAGNQHDAWLSPHLNPTPLLSFGIEKCEAQAGIMITASHNPSEYNGLKMFDSTGCQIIDPWDQKIIQYYKQLESFAGIQYLNFPEALDKKFISWWKPSLEESYLQMVEQHCLDLPLCQEKGTNLSIVYTPLHGTGFPLCPKILKRLGFSSCLVVPEQQNPDPNFSTVQFPNPEDPEALNLALSYAKKNQADLVMANDPDADRLGMMVKDKIGDFHFLTGNQIGVLILHYLLTKLSEKKQITSDALVIKSVVTTELQTKIAHHFEVKMINTLTGFKWMGGYLNQMKAQKIPTQFLFATEESYGYLAHSHSKDKDGIQAIALMAEIALWYKTQKMTLLDALDKIYDQFGYYQEKVISLSYPGKSGQEKIQQIMEIFRHTPDFLNEYHSIVEIMDFKKKISLNTQKGLETVLDLPSSNLLGFVFDSGDRLYLRPSGTEPKIKFYLMITATQESLSDKKNKALEKISRLEKIIRSKLL